MEIIAIEHAPVVLFHFSIVIILINYVTIWLSVSYENNIYSKKTAKVDSLTALNVHTFNIWIAMDENFEHEINELNDVSPIDINYLNFKLYYEVIKVGDLVEIVNNTFDCGTRYKVAKIEGDNIYLEGYNLPLPRNEVILIMQ